MKRGIARRVVFPGRAVIRTFLAALACAVRRGEIEVHAFCLLPTHFHLLVRSPRGRLSEALRRTQNDFVRRTNRRARRDGAMFRGRFKSVPVLSERYHDVLVRYIEANPVVARIVPRAEDYPYGSAYHRARGSVPPWLASSWTDDRLAQIRQVDPGATYVSIWCEGASTSEQELVELRMCRPVRDRDDLDDLVGAAPESIQRWMEAKARLADGGPARLAYVDADTVDDVLSAQRLRLGPWLRRPQRGPALELWAVARSGLLRDMAGLTHGEVAQRLGVTTTFAGRQLTRHRGLLSDPTYAARLGVLGKQCMDRAHPARRTSESRRP